MTLLGVATLDTSRDDVKLALAGLTPSPEHVAKLLTPEPGRSCQPPVERLGYT